jgi:hypothetical protein
MKLGDIKPALLETKPMWFEEFKNEIFARPPVTDHSEASADRQVDFHAN